MTPNFYFRHLFDANPVPMYVFDVESFDLLAVNGAAASLWGHPLEQLRRMKATDLRPPDAVDAFVRHIAALGPEDVDRGDFRHCASDGRLLDVEVQSREIRFDGRRARLTVLKDVSAQREMERALRASHLDLAHSRAHDALTGLANRGAFMRRAGEALAGAPDSRHAVVLVKVDRLRSINDSFGTTFGNALLLEVTARLGATLRGSDVCARLDNVKFGLLWRETGEGELAVRLEALRERLSGAFHLGGDNIMLSVTAGAACYPDHGKEMDALLRNAGMAQRSAHATSPGAVQLFDDGMASGLERRRWVESALDQALAGRAFRLHYQPKVNLLQQRALDMEALLRWPQEDGSFIGPAEFIPLLEETGCIVQVGEWVLETAARQVRSWLDAGLPIGRVAVNVSPRQFAQVDLAERFAAIARAAGVPPSKIELEITESCLMRNATRTIETLGALKQHGFFLAMDDFGTGYSSLSYLKRFPLDTLKIDRSFICDVATDPYSAAMVRMIVSLARSRQLRIVAEGVETAEQAALLARLGCDEIQGFFFSRPLDAEACTAWLARGGRCPLPALDSTRGRTLLLVDDDPAILAALKLLLEDEGYRIFTAENGADGLQQLARNAVDVVISDQRLPSGSGVEFLSRVKQLHPGTVRMVLSGHADLSSVTDAVNRGAVYKFLTKPWNNNELRAIVREAFRQRPVSQDHRHAEKREQQHVPGPPDSGVVGYMRFAPVGGRKCA